ncbi:MAG TPA: hypothetical protein VGI61_13750, partial [Parafilimonas sp.]
MEQTKTLVILSPGFAKDEQDTTCLPPQQIFVRALNKNFHSLKIFILAFEYPYTSENYKWFGNDVISFNGFGKRKVLRLLLWLRVYKALRKIKKQNNLIGLLSFWCSECAIVGKNFSKRNALKHFIWILGQDAKKSNHYVRWIKPNSEELIALSDFITETFFENHKVKPAHTIPIGVEATMFPV